MVSNSSSNFKTFERSVTSLSSSPIPGVDESPTYQRIRVANGYSDLPTFPELEKATKSSLPPMQRMASRNRRVAGSTQYKCAGINDLLYIGKVGRSSDSKHENSERCNPSSSSMDDGGRLKELMMDVPLSEPDDFPSSFQADGLDLEGSGFPISAASKQPSKRIDSICALALSDARKEPERDETRSVPNPSFRKRKASFSQDCVPGKLLRNDNLVTSTIKLDPKVLLSEQNRASKQGLFLLNQLKQLFHIVDDAPTVLGSKHPQAGCDPLLLRARGGSHEEGKQQENLHESGIHDAQVAKEHFLRIPAEEEDEDEEGRGRNEGCYQGVVIERDCLSFGSNVEQGLESKTACWLTEENGSVCKSSRMIFLDDYLEMSTTEKPM